MMVNYLEDIINEQTDINKLESLKSSNFTKFISNPLFEFTQENADYLLILIDEKIANLTV